LSHSASPPTNERRNKNFSMMKQNKTKGLHDHQSALQKTIKEILYTEEEDIYNHENTEKNKSHQMSR
jgi:hypothetical protein